MGWFNLCFLLLICLAGVSTVSAQQTSGFNRDAPQLPAHASGVHLKGSQDQLSWVAVAGAHYYYIEAYRGYEVYQARDKSAIDAGIMGNGRDQLSQANAVSSLTPRPGERIAPRYRSYGRSYTLDAPFDDARYLIIPCNRMGCGAGFVAEQYDAQQYYLNIESFQSDRLTVLPWEKAKLSWKVVGAYSVSLLKDGQPYRTGLRGIGSEVVKLNETARFTLRVEGHNRRIAEKHVQLVYHEVDDPDTVHQGAYSVRLQSLGLDPVARTVVVDDNYLFLVDKNNTLHKVDHRPQQAKVVWTQQLSGKVINRPLVFDNALYFGVSKLDGSGQVCKMSTHYSTYARCQSTPHGVVAGAVMVHREREFEAEPIDGPLGERAMQTSWIPPMPLTDHGIVFIDNKGLVMEYNKSLSKLHQSSYLPEPMRTAPFIATPAVVPETRTLYVQYHKPSNNRLSVAAISVDDTTAFNPGDGVGSVDPVGPIDPIHPGGPLDPINPGGPIDQIGPGKPIDRFSAPMRLPSERELARSIQNAAYNDNMITVEWTKEVGAGNE
ncbi:hypothetical protein [Pseudoalteromonas rubra]|uniref:hypothetical protein n=1 Tax=Pseudoalteromonas rubra TaxID=43658 RepID=UPI000F7A7D30|nr:hypothetical protein [Pseudoalteromonas rubra]